MELKNWPLDSFSQKIPWKLSDIRSNGSLCNAPLRVGGEYVSPPIRCQMLAHFLLPLYHIWIVILQEGKAL